MDQTVLKNILPRIVADTDLHARWLNTLSLMENTGARKISASEHKLQVDLMILKHAAEEARHAYYLKRQIGKIDSTACPDYSYRYLIAPHSSAQYLQMLDVEICRYLKKELGLSSYRLKYAAYLLVTYAIEVRADELYPVYQEALTEAGSKVNVKSIIAEEEGHLEEMIRQLEAFSPDWKMHAGVACDIEARLFDQWTQAINAELKVNN